MDVMKLGFESLLLWFVMVIHAFCSASFFTQGVANVVSADHQPPALRRAGGAQGRDHVLGDVVAQGGGGHGLEGPLRFSGLYAITSQL